VRDASSAKVSANKEVMDLMSALGLNPNAAAGRARKAATATDAALEARGQATLKGLRYGRLMLMMDQDEDGSHIKGLLISLVHHYWPELLHTGFVQEFVTPLLKAQKGATGVRHDFFSFGEFERFMASKPHAERGKWRTKYYKGLGTSSSREAREYFGDLARHRVQLHWRSERDDDLLRLAFCKHLIAERKDWLNAKLLEPPADTEAETDARTDVDTDAHADVDTDGGEAAGAAPSAQLEPRRLNVAQLKSELARRSLDTSGRKQELVGRLEVALAGGDAPVQQAAPRERTFEHFVQHDLIQFSLSDLRRSIPSAIDGLKPSQRKVLFACQKRQGQLLRGQGLKVAQLSGFVAERTNYHHGEVSLHSTIIGMAQDFVGSNNLPLIIGEGQFGTRMLGGDDHAAARYIYAKLNPVVSKLFPEADEAVLNYRSEDGMLVEPEHFVPLLPLLLINGAQGIGTGWSTQVWQYHPLHVLEAALDVLHGRSPEELVPWAKGFRGEIELVRNLEGGDLFSLSHCTPFPHMSPPILPISHISIVFFSLSLRVARALHLTRHRQVRGRGRRRQRAPAARVDAAQAGRRLQGMASQAAQGGRTLLVEWVHRGAHRTTRELPPQDGSGAAGARRVHDGSAAFGGTPAALDAHARQHARLRRRAAAATVRVATRHCEGIRPGAPRDV
tara:strand:- start:743 stop:2767 length:2025 start_codon:yes stop_codon:yes gene_type:complete